MKYEVEPVYHPHRPAFAVFDADSEQSTGTKLVVAIFVDVYYDGKARKRAEALAAELNLAP